MTLPAEGSELARAALDRRIVSGVAWTAVARWGSQIVSWASMLLLARLLSPSDFGLFGMTWIFLGLVRIVSEFGLGSTIIVMKELSAHEIRQTHVLCIFLGIGGSIAALLAANPLAAFFRNPRLESLVPVLGIGFALSGLSVVPQSILLRDFKFKLVSGFEALQTILQALVSVLSAWAGMGYWSLVLGGLVGSAIASLLLYVASPCGFAWPVFSRIRGALQYSWRSLVSNTTWYLYTNADFVVAGRVLGDAVLGVYYLAWNLANIPVDRIVTMILRVTPSIFANIQHEQAELRRYLRVLTEGMALVVFPIGLGAALVADPLVSAFFDKRWTNLAMPFRLLALNCVLRCVVVLIGQVQFTIRDVRYRMWHGIVSLLVLPASFLYASRWGGAGIAAAWLCLYPILNAPVLFRVLHKIAMPKREYLSAFEAPGIASAAMILSVVAFERCLPSLPAMVQLIAEVTIGGAIYVSVLLLFFRQRVNAFLGLLLARRHSPAQA
jgi:PST family polysaccharide transporter